MSVAQSVVMREWERNSDGSTFDNLQCALLLASYVGIKQFVAAILYRAQNNTSPGLFTLSFF